MKLFNKFKSIIRDRIFTPDDLEDLYMFCQGNDLNGIKKLFENRRIRLFKIPCDDLLKGIFQKGYLEVAQYLLTSKYTKEFHKEKLDEHLKYGCLTGGKEIVKYILGSPELLKRVDLSKLSETVFESSCVMMNTPVINYILSNKEILKYIDLHQNDDEFFKRLVYHEEYETMQYLVLNVRIEQTEHIKRFLSSENMVNYYNNIENIRNMFEMRNLSEDLDKELKVKSGSVKKVKI